MASPAQIAEVRANTNEPTQDPFTDAVLGLLVDNSGVDRASAIVWERKAASWSELVTTSEAGASRSLSDLSRNAREMAVVWNGKADKLINVRAAPRTRRIVR